MKKILLSTFLLAAIGTLYTGCKKDSDTTGPVVTLIGNNPMFVVAIDEDFYTTNPGATSLDDKDGDLTSKITVDYGNYSEDIAKNKAGDYNINYSSSDKSGNTTTETRLIFVTHTGAQLDGLSFQANDTASSGNLDYLSGFSKSSASKYRVFADNFSDALFTAGSEVYMNMEANRITIPTQTPNGTGSSISISGSGTISKNIATGIYTIHLTYTVIATGTGGGTVTYRSTLVSQ